MDRALMEGQTLLDQSIEPDTGFPSWMTHGKDALGAFKAVPDMNYARGELERARKSETDPTPGKGWRLDYDDGAKGD
ncbi:hypothetical protein [Demequina sp. SO4-18]|uniref:hypothetical protein n=1 Tax=Demequina sp. SO4-18 TaxID=3401026 RepID=UPI003B5AE55A